MRCLGSRDSRNHIVAASIPLNDFPIRVFSNHFARAECIEVASPNLHLRAILASAGEAPFRNSRLRFQIDKMLSIPVMDVGQSFKTWSQPFPDIMLTLKARAIRFTPPRHLQHAIIGKESQDPIQIVRVERITYLY